MTTQSVGSMRIDRVRYGMRLRVIDIVSFFVVVALIPTQVDWVLPQYCKEMILTAGVLYILFRYLSEKKSIDVCLIAWLIFSAWLSVCNLLNSRSIAYSIYFPMKVMVFILFNKFYLERRDTTLLRIIRHYLTILIIITFSIQMIDQDMFGFTISHNQINFLESDNYLGWYYIPYIALCVILDFVERKKIRRITYLEIGLCTVSIVRAWVGKTLIGLTIINFYILFIYRKKIAKLFIPKMLGIGYLIINFGIIFYRIQEWLPSAIFEFLGKEKSLSYRTEIWASVLQNIRNSPVYGYGVAHGGELYYTWFGRHELPAHNLFLEVMMQAGIVGLVLYFLILFVMFYIGHQNYKKDKRSRNYRYEYLFLVFTTVLILGMAILSNPIYIPFFYLTMILLMNFDSLVDMHERDNLQSERMVVRTNIQW